MHTYISNINKVLNVTNSYQFEDGLKWYDDAREFCSRVSIMSNVPYINVCAILAALSPRNKWERNKADCYELCIGNESHKYGTFSAMVKKAKLIKSLTKYSDIIKALNGPKIISFFDNIYDENSQHVTVDFHMHHIALGKYYSEEERPSLNKSTYDEIQRAIEIVAHNNKLRPYELQAILWVTWRENENAILH